MLHHMHTVDFSDSPMVRHLLTSWPATRHQNFSLIYIFIFYEGASGGNLSFELVFQLLEGLSVIRRSHKELSSTARDKLKHLTIKDHQYGLNCTFFFFTFLFCVCVCVCACGWVFYYIFLLAFWSFPFTCAICSTVLSSLFDLFSFEKGRAILIYLLKLGLFLNLFINYRPQRQLR